MANKTLQFLRNSSLRTTKTYNAENYNTVHDAARAELEDILKASTAKDGEPILIRYKEEGADQVERTLLGIKSASGFEIFDNAAGNDAIDAAIEALKNGASDGFDTLKEIEDVIKALNASSVADNNKIVTDVTQTDGKITATASNITGVKLDGYAVGTDADVAATDTLGEALGKLQAQINAMDLTEVKADGEVITAVSEQDGKVSASKTAIKDVKLTGYAKDTTKTGGIAATDDIEDALSKIENQIVANSITNADGSITVTPVNGSTDIKVHIKNGEKVIKLDANEGGIYTDLDLVKINSGLPSTVKERYQLLASDDTQIGVNIDIPKDSHIVSINYIKEGEHAQNLEYVYVDVDGNTQTTYVDMSELVLEAEFASGVAVTDHVVHGVVDSTSEQNSQDTPASFLTVGEGGFKVSGIKDEIDRKINALDATVGDSTVATGKHVAVQVVETGGKITAVNVTESDIASATALTEEITNRTNADTALSDRLGEDVTSSNTAAAQLAALRGTESDTSVSASIVGAKKYTDEKVADVVAGLDGAAVASTVAAGTDTIPSTDFTVLTKVNEVDGVIKPVGAGDNDSKSVLLKKVAATGAAADVAIEDSNDKFAATTVEGALAELAAFDCGTY